MDFAQFGVDVCADAWMAHGFGSRLARPTHVLKVSQGLLAQMMGSSRQSIDAALRELEAREVIAQHYRTIEVLDLAGLMRHAELR